MSFGDYPGRVGLVRPLTRNSFAARGIALPEGLMSDLWIAAKPAGPRGHFTAGYLPLGVYHRRQRQAYTMFCPVKCLLRHSCSELMTLSGHPPTPGGTLTKMLLY